MKQPVTLVVVFSDAHLAGDLPIDVAGTFDLTFVEPPEDLREVADDDPTC